MRKHQSKALPRQRTCLRCFAGLLSLALLMLCSFVTALAQQNSPLMAPDHPHCEHLMPDGGTESQNPLAVYVPNGWAVTPKGDVRVLIIYAGFTQDNQQEPNGTGTPGIPQNTGWSDTNNLWPQTSPTHPVWGTALPRNNNEYFYTDPVYSAANFSTPFSSSANDKTISNFYYQMSRTSPTPFKVKAGHFPDRINVQGVPGRTIAQYNMDVLNQIKNNPAYSDFPWWHYDLRGNNIQPTDSRPITAVLLPTKK